MSSLVFLLVYGQIFLTKVRESVILSVAVRSPMWIVTLKSESSVLKMTHLYQLGISRKGWITNNHKVSAAGSNNHISRSQVCGSLGLADLGCSGLGGCNYLSCVLIWLGASWGLSLAAQTSVLHISHPLPVWVNSHDNSRSDGEQTQ